MLFLCFSPIFLGINAFYAYELFKWIDSLGISNAKVCKTIKIAFGVVWGFCSTAIFWAFLIPGSISYEKQPALYVFRRILKQIGNYHLAVFFYMGMSLIVILLLRLIERLATNYKNKHIEDYKEKPRRKLDALKVFDISIQSRQHRRAILGILNLAFIIAITLYGVHNARDIKVNNYDITVHKSVNGLDDLKVVLVADLHMGYNIGCEQIEKMVKLINDEDADLVVIAGDIFDNEYEALDNPERLIELLSTISSRYGTYAVYGNHDIEEKIIGGFTFDWHGAKESNQKMDEMLKKAGIRLLRDEYVSICDNQIYVYGRPDYERPGKGIERRLSPEELTRELDLCKPVIVLDHEPRELKELANAGVDIDLCGHTHDGQFFPMNITSRYITWENSAGLLKKGNMSNIVTSGVGLYGPNIRVGTQAEICSILVHFKE